MEEVAPRWRAGEAQIRDNPEGGELDPHAVLNTNFENLNTLTMRSNNMKTLYIIILPVV